MSFSAYPRWRLRALQACDAFGIPTDSPPHEIAESALKHDDDEILEAAREFLVIDLAYESRFYWDFFKVAYAAPVRDFLELVAFIHRKHLNEGSRGLVARERLYPQLHLCALRGWDR